MQDSRNIVPVSAKPTQDVKRLFTRLGSDRQSSISNRILEVCMQKGIYFEDPAFGPCGDHPVYFRAGLPDVRWGKVSSILGQNAPLFSTIRGRALKQGLLTGSYFLSALACLAEQPRLIKRLFGLEGGREGVYTVWIQIEGVWAEQILDEYVPVVPNREGISIAGTQSSQGDLWPILLEKGYAKAWGGYEAIDGGNPIYTLRDLTGAPYSIFRDLDQSDALWERLKAATAREWLLVASPHSNAGQGLQKDFLYPLREIKEGTSAKGKYRLVRVADPRGNSSVYRSMGYRIPRVDSRGAHPRSF